MTDKLAGELIAAYNRGFEDGYECGVKDQYAYKVEVSND